MDKDIYDLTLEDFDKLIMTNSLEDENGNRYYSNMDNIIICEGKILMYKPNANLKFRLLTRLDDE